MFKNFDELSQKLWQDYIKLNGDASKVTALFNENNISFTNDHIALRTFNKGNLTKEHLTKFFKKFGYFANGDYHFKQKKLDAVHLENKNPEFPKIFISELKTEDFSPRIQTMVDQVVQATKDLNTAELFSQRHTWSINHKEYLALASESEYASWVYVFGFCANHFTVLVNSLSQFNELTDLNVWLKNNGFVLNSAGGEIKGTPEQMLVQSSTKAPLIEVTFEDGVFKVPGCYYEFAKRFKDSSGEYFQGFITGSADKIFESTDR